VVSRENPEESATAKPNPRQTIHWPPLLVIVMIVAAIVVISLNENPVNVAALPTAPPIEAEALASPAVTITPVTPVRPTPPESTAVPSTTPTVRPSDGRRFVLRYDDNTLFMRNTSGDQIEVSSFAFERLDMSGNPLNHVEGSRWARLYPYIRPQSCIKIMFWDKISVLSPPSCRSINSEVWEQSGSSLDFWTPQDGSREFRVLWNDQEIARCEISAGKCEVFTP
jgi:hypothetical protein